MTLPSAILFDLDDTIISAYVQPSAAWSAVAAELAHELAPLTVTEAVQAITHFAREYWDDAARAEAARRELRRARREIVATALATLATQGRPAVAAELALRLADPDHSSAA